MTNITHVAVAVIVNQSNQVCISLRHKDAHQGGRWEFPGGKVEHDETIEQALAREIKEELNLEITHSRPLITVRHDYQDKKVCLHVRKILSYKGKAVGQEGQQVKWVSVVKLADYTFPVANTAIVKSLQLPDKYLITGKFTDIKNFAEKLEKALDEGIALVQLRLKNDSMADLSQAQALLKKASTLCSSVNAKLMLNLSDAYNETTDLPSIVFDGFHADSRTLKNLSERPQAVLFSASCHNSEELLKAVQLKADFVVLSPVQKTASHPEMQGIGWQQFSSMIEDIPIPVYALGGISESDMEIAWLNGAQGVSAISAFWK